jgi:hypothetical protein
VTDEWMSQDELLKRVTEVVGNELRAKNRILHELRSLRIGSWAETRFLANSSGGCDLSYKYSYYLDNIEILSHVFWCGVSVEDWDLDENAATYNGDDEDLLGIVACVLHFKRSDADLVWPAVADVANLNTAAPGNSQESSYRGTGRPAGSGLAHVDRLLFDDIDRLVLSGKALGVTGAALLLKDRLEGAGSLESRAKRVARLYAKERRRAP